MVVVHGRASETGLYVPLAGPTAGGDVVIHYGNSRRDAEIAQMEMESLGRKAFFTASRPRRWLHNQCCQSALPAMRKQFDSTTRKKRKALDMDEINNTKEQSDALVLLGIMMSDLVRKMLRK